MAVGDDADDLEVLAGVSTRELLADRVFTRPQRMRRARRDDGRHDSSIPVALVDGATLRDWHRQRSEVIGADEAIIRARLLRGRPQIADSGDQVHPGFASARKC
jgi:hypothetical protein